MAMLDETVIDGEVVKTWWQRRRPQGPDHQTDDEEVGEGLAWGVANFRPFQYYILDL
jgi:hypothetical protein